MNKLKLVKIDLIFRVVTSMEFCLVNKDYCFLLVINDYDTIYKVSICACNVHHFPSLTKTTLQEESVEASLDMICE